MPNPWDREDQEPTKAYSAFLTYRDLGPRRTVLEAYRLNRALPEAKASSGGFLKWYKDFRWAERAEHWDIYCKNIRDEANRQANEQAISRAVQFVHVEVPIERIKTAQRGIEYGRKCIDRGEVLLSFPLADKRVTKTVVDPISKRVYELETHWEGMDARMVALATKIGEGGFAIIHDALDRVEALERGDVKSAELSERQQQQAMDKAERLWQEWEAEKQRVRATSSRHQLMAPPGTDSEEAVS